MTQDGALPAPEPPPTEPATGEPGEEQRSGLSPRGQQVATLLTQVATTARSFLFYDAHNAAIRQFLETLLAAFAAALREGSVVLEMQPLEVWHQGEVVYLNRDRDRSLAFKLYRDGVRGLTFQPGFDWEEMTRLLEILSVRYTGVHQHEDDMVTLLWKGGFAHLEVLAVEGFVPEDDEEPDAWRGPGADSAGDGEAFPEGLRLPRPRIQETRPVAWAAVAEDRLEALKAEASAGALPTDCLALLRRLRSLLDDPGERMPFSEVAHVFSEVRDFLSSEETLAQLVVFLDLLGEMAAAEPPPWDAARAAAARQMVHSCGEVRAVARLLHSMPSEERRLPPELVAVLDRACEDPLAAVAAALASERSVAARAASRQLLEHYAGGRTDQLEQRYREASGPVAADLLRAMAHVGGDRLAPLLAHECAHPAGEVQEEALWHLERLPYSSPLGRALLESFRLADPARRPRLLALLVRSGDRRFVDALARFLEERASGLALEEAAAIGQALGRLGGPSTLGRWTPWLRPPGLLSRLVPPPPALAVAASQALAEIPGEAAAQALRAALPSAAPEVRPWLGRALTARRQAPAPPGGAS